MHMPAWVTVGHCGSLWDWVPVGDECVEAGPKRTIPVCHSLAQPMSTITISCPSQYEPSQCTHVVLCSLAVD